MTDISKATPDYWLEESQSWPWEIKIMPISISVSRAAYSTAAKTHAEMMEGKGFTGDEKLEAEYANEQQIAELKRVVRAVNSYEPMLEALKFYADLERYRGPTQRRQDGDKYTPEESPFTQDVTKDNGDIARRAIAIAEGRQS
jgi:hypothetical protein